MGVGALVTPIKLRFKEGQYGLDVPELAGGHVQISNARNSGRVAVTRDSFILMDNIYNTDGKRKKIRSKN